MNAVLLFRRMPFLRFLIPLILGISVGFYCVGFDGWNYCALASAILLLLWSLFFRGNYAYRFRWIFGAFLFLTLFFVGAYRTNEARSALRSEEEKCGGVLLAELKQHPVAKANSYAVEAEVSDSMKKHFRLMLYLAKDSASKALKRGDKLLFLENSYQKRRLNPNEFDYEKLLHLKGISASCYLASGKWRKVGSNESFSLRAVAEACQQRLLNKLMRYGLSGDELALVSAMVLGNRDYMESDLRNSYSATGASHILAVSGLHVGVVFFVLNALLKLLFRGRLAPVRFSVLLIALWAYAFITGLPASVVRASFMLSLVVVGQMINRTSSVYNTVFVSAFFMLLYNPFYLFDVGFQLSYVAVFSILLFQPKIYSLLEVKGRFLNWAWSLFSVSLAAQIGTLPVVLYNFHQFAIYFWLSGMWVVPLSAVVIYLALFFLVLPEVGIVCSWVGKLLSWVAWVMNEGVMIAEHLPTALIANIRFGVVEVVASYVVIVFLYLAMARFCYRSVRNLLMVTVVATVCCGVHGYSLSLEEGIAVFDVKGVSVVNYYGRGRNEVRCSGEEELVRRRLAPFWLAHNCTEAKVTQQEGFLFDDMRIYVHDDSSLLKKEAHAPLEVDVLVVGKDAVTTVADLCRLFTFRQLVLDSSNSWRFSKRIKRECEALGVDCYDVVERGAWIKTKPLMVGL